MKCLPLPLGRLPRPSKSMAAARINPMLIRIARPDIEKDPATGEPGRGQVREERPKASRYRRPVSPPGGCYRRSSSIHEIVVGHVDRAAEHGGLLSGNEAFIAPVIELALEVAQNLGGEAVAEIVGQHGKRAVGMAGGCEWDHGRGCAVQSVDRVESVFVRRRVKAHNRPVSHCQLRTSHPLAVAMRAAAEAMPPITHAPSRPGAWKG